MLNTQDIISEKDAANYLGLKVNTLRGWACRRKGPPRIKVGKKIWYRQEALTEWMHSQETDPAEARRKVLGAG